MTVTAAEMTGVTPWWMDPTSPRIGRGDAGELIYVVRDWTHLRGGRRVLGVGPACWLAAERIVGIRVSPELIVFALRHLVDASPRDGQLYMERPHWRRVIRDYQRREGLR